MVSTMFHAIERLVWGNALKNSILAALLSCAAATASVAQGVWVEDGWTCASWAEARTAKAARPLEQHLVGVLNGVSLATGKDFWHGGTRIDSRQAFFWMDKFCAENPLAYLLTGAFNLVTERLGEDWKVTPQK